MSAEALKASIIRRMVGIPVEKLGLERRVPEFCRRMGWPEGELVDGIARGHAFVGAALACYAVGAIHQQMRVPEFMRFHPSWKALVAQYGDLVTADIIVECFSPDALDVGHLDRLDTLLGEEAKRAVLR